MPTVYRDNCQFQFNPNQRDNRGVLPFGSPSGIGRECECGDVNNNGGINNADALFMLDFIINPTVLPIAKYRADKQNVNNKPGLANGDVLRLLGAIIGANTIAPKCDAALP